MKKFLVAILISLFLTVSAWVGAWAFEPGERCQQSAVKADDAIILTGAGYFYGIMVTTDGTNAVTVAIYDGTDNTGTEIIPDWIVTTSGANRAQTLSISPPVGFNTGCFVDVTVGGGGTVAYTVYYRNQ